LGVKQKSTPEGGSLNKNKSTLLGANVLICGEAGIEAGCK
jgi:hypothetical protein